MASFEFGTGSGSTGDYTARMLQLGSIHDQVIQSEGATLDQPLDIDKRLEELSTQLLAGKEAGMSKEKQKLLKIRITNLTCAKEIEKLVDQVNKILEAMVRNIKH
jgi:hypothetical protein